MKLDETLNAIKPYVLGWIGTLGGGSGPYAPSPHDLNSAHHSGSIADTQATQFLMTNGSRALTGNMAVNSGITIDGVDLSAFASEAFVTMGNTTGLANERALTAGAGLTLSDGGAGSAATLAVGAGSGITVNADDVALTTPGSLSATSTNSATGNHTHAIDSTIARSAITVTGTGALGGGGDLTTNRTITLNTPGTLTVSSSNSSTTNHTHAVTSSSNPGAAASLLASDAAGALQLVNLTLTGVLTTPRVTAAANLTIDPAGDVIFDPAGNDILPNTTYDLNLGALNKKYLTVHAAELWVETLVAQDTIATIGGRVIVAPTTTLIADLASGGTTIDVKHNQLQSGDRVLLQANGLLEWMAIASAPTAISGGYRYSVTRNLDGTGANAWNAGDAVVNTGTAGSGFIDLYSLESVNGTPPDYAYNYNHTGTAFSANYAGSSAWTIFGDSANTEVNDAVYFGVAGTTWENLFYTIGTAAAYTATLVWEYWNGSAWTSFTPTTTDFKATGLQSTTWTAASLTGWAATTVNSLSAYWVRVRISAFTSWTTQPTQAGRRVYRYRRQVGPAVTGWVRNSATFNDITEHWAIGNLNGLYGYSADTFGVAVGKYSASTSWLGADATNGIRVMYGATQLAQWDASGNILIGQAAASQDNLLISSGAISIRNNTTERIGMTAAGVLTIKDSGGAAVFTFDASAGAEFTKPLTLGTSGGIYQGTGTFASPTTGLKIWNDSGVGRIGGYNGGTLQWYGSTDGKLYAGGGSVVIDATGLHLTGDVIEFKNGTTSVGSINAGSTSTLTFNLTTSAGLIIGDISNYLKVVGGVNVGSATGAGTGQVFTSSSIFLNDTANANMTTGLTINQDSADNEILAFKSSDVAHGLTTQTETDTFGLVKKEHADNGGLRLFGFSEDVMGLTLLGSGNNEDTAKSTAALAPVTIRGFTDSGTNVAAVGADSNIVVFRNGTTTRFILDGDGDSHQDVGTAWTNFDAHDDVELLTALSVHVSQQGDPIRTAFNQFLEFNRARLEALKLVAFNDDGHHFVNLSRLTMLLVGAVRQLHGRLERLERIVLA